MSKILDSIHEVWLSSKWPRLIMVSSISLSLGTLIPIEWLQIVGLHLSPEELSSVRKVGIPWLLLFALAISHCWIVYDLISARTSRHPEEVEKLLLAATSAINNRSNLTINSVFDFKNIFDSNKVYLHRNQERFLSALLSDIQDLRIITTARKGDITDAQRSKYIDEERVLLNRVEESKSIIEKFRREFA